MQRWVVQLGRAALGTLALAALAVAFAYWQLAKIAEWAIESALPGVRAKVGRLFLENPRRLVVRELELKTHSGGELLASLRSGALEFDLPGLLRRELARIELVEPHLSISPRALELLGTPRGSKSGPGSADAHSAKGSGGGAGSWRLGAWSCQYGTFDIAGFGAPQWEARGKFLLQNEKGTLGLAVWDGQVVGEESKEFLWLDLVEVAGLEGLAAGKLGRVRVRGGAIELGVALGRRREQGSPLPDLLLQEVVIERFRVRVPAGAAMPGGLSFAINSNFQSVGLGQLAASVAEQRQFVEFEDVEILSPLDPLATVLSVRAIGCTFTLAGLASRQIESVHVTSPTLHISEDLFWLMDSKESGGDAEDWGIQRLTVADGRLLIGSGGRSALGLPLRFRSTASNVSLSSLASLRANLTLEIPSRSYEFPSYELEFRTSEGNLRFAYPPDSGAKNLVGTVHLPSLRWRQFEATEGWVTVTFDRQGINGSFGAAFYGGYLGGGFSFLFHPDAPWIGWAAGTQWNLRQLTRVMAPDRLLMKGLLDFDVAVDANGPQISRVIGTLATAGAGRLEIPKLDDLLGAIPKDWPAIRQSSTELALRTLRDFDFDRGSGRFWFAGGRGQVRLELRGPTGSRTLEIVLHEKEPSAPSGGRRKKK